MEGRISPEYRCEYVRMSIRGMAGRCLFLWSVVYVAVAHYCLNPSCHPKLANTVPVMLFSSSPISWIFYREKPLTCITQSPWGAWLFWTFVYIRSEYWAMGCCLLMCWVFPLGFRSSVLGVVFIHSIFSGPCCQAPQHGLGNRQANCSQLSLWAGVTTPDLPLTRWDFAHVCQSASPGRGW
jgi:hypothetical protein